MAKPILTWTLVTGACVLALVGTHALRWPARGNLVRKIASSFDAVAPKLPLDRPLAIRVVGFADYHFHYLRYAAVPRPLELKLARAEHILLLASDSLQSAAARRLLQERPDLKLDTTVVGDGYSLALYQ